MGKHKRWGLVSLVCFALGLALTTHRAQHFPQACNLLATAQDEAQMAEAWHLQAGEVLAECGVLKAKETAASKACYARRFNDTSVTCY